MRIDRLTREEIRARAATEPAESIAESLGLPVRRVVGVILARQIGRPRIGRQVQVVIPERDIELACAAGQTIAGRVRIALDLLGGWHADAS